MYKTRIPQKILSVLIAALLLLSPVTIFAATNEASINLQATYGQTAARSMLEYVNKFRTGRDVDGQPVSYTGQDGNQVSVTGLSELKYDYELEKAAMQRAAEIALKFDHTRPDGSACFSVYPSYLKVGENIAAGNSTALATFRQWREDNLDYADQGHRRNMLDSDFNAIGIGHAVVNNVHYWVQALGRTGAETEETAAFDSVTFVPMTVDADKFTDVNMATSETSYTLDVGQSSELPIVSMTFKYNDVDAWPSGASRTASFDAVWSSEDTSVACIEGIKVKGVSAGTTNLTATVNGTVLTVPVTVNGAQYSVYENLKYTVSDGEVTITGHTAEAESLTRIDIPDKIDGKPVTAIGDHAFTGCGSLDHVYVPYGVTSIGTAAFFGCANLYSIMMPDTVLSIGEDAFGNCEKFGLVYYRGDEAEWNSIAIADGNDVLNSATKIYQVAYPIDLRVLVETPEYAYVYEPFTITVMSDDTVIDPKVYDEDGNDVGSMITSRIVNESGGVTWTISMSVATVGTGLTFTLYDVGRETPEELKSFVIDIIENVGPFDPSVSFTYEINDGEITITGCDESVEGMLFVPGNIDGLPVTAIADGAFANCTKLTDIEIPATVTSIGSNIFYDKDSIYMFCYSGSYAEQYAIENGIAYYAWGNEPEPAEFYYSINEDNEITITGIANEVSGFLFIPFEIDGCTVTAIADGAFANCPDLDEVDIPTTVTSIGKDIFYDNNRILIDCYSGSAAHQYAIENDIAYYLWDEPSDPTYPFTYEIGENDEAIITGCNPSYEGYLMVPDGIYGCPVTTIADGAFANCPNITEIEIPDSVTSIGNEIFCDKDTVTIYATLNSYAIQYAVENEIAYSVITYSREGVYGPWSYYLITFEEYGSDGVIAISGFNGDPEDMIEVPSDIYGWPVKEIWSIDNFETELTNVTIPASVNYIAPFAFENCVNLTVYGYSGSYAEEYAIGNGIPFVPLVRQPIIAPDIAEVGKPFEINVLADKNTEKLKVYNEKGNVVGSQVVRINDNGDGTFYWTLSLTVGTVGRNRTFTVKDGSGNTLGSFTVDIEFFESAANPQVAYVNEPFEIMVTLANNVKSPGIINEKGNPVSFNVVSAEKNSIFTTWYLSLKLGTAGQGREFTIIDKATGEEFFTLRINILPKVSTQVTAPDSAVVNESFTVDLITPESLTRPIIVNEKGSKIGSTVISKSTENGVTSWKLSLSVGSKGENRRFSIKDSSTGNPTIAEFTISITEQADRIISVEAPATAKANEAFTVTTVVSSALTKGKFTSENGNKIGATVVSKTNNGDTTTVVYSLSVGSSGQRTLTFNADYDKHSEWPFSRSFDITIEK